jgi:hypothetical protein
MPLFQANEGPQFRYAVHHAAGKKFFGHLRMVLQQRVPGERDAVAIRLAG